MNIHDIVRTVSDRIQNTAGVNTVYGDPITAEGKTIVPVARVRYGFGGSGGTQGGDTSSSNGDMPLQMEGGGGGIEAVPVGFIEITPGETRYVSFEERRKVVRTIVIGLLLAIFLLRRRHRK